MHGAALTYALLLPPHAALVELWPQVGGWGGSAAALLCRTSSSCRLWSARKPCDRPSTLHCLPASSPPGCHPVPWAQAEGIWRCYENAAQWAGALYRRVANADPARHRQTTSGDVTEVDAAALAAAVRELAPLVRQRRAAAGRGRQAAGGQLPELLTRR